MKNLNLKLRLNLKYSITIAALALAAAILTAGCAAMNISGGFEPAENCIYIEKDGTVQWAAVETNVQGNYTEEELNTSVQKKISAYNASLDKPAVAENTEGAEKLPVAFVSSELKEGTFTLITEYNIPSRLIDFANNIGDYNVTFTSLNTGWANAMSGEFAGVSFKDEKGKGVDVQAVKSKGENMAIKSEGQGVIKTEQKILYVSDNCTLKDANTVQTSPEGISYIILK